MTPDEKQLLTIDLCARLPYRVKISTSKGVRDLFKINLIDAYPHGSIFSCHAYNFKFGEFLSILRPMSQLTQEIAQANYNDGKPFVPIVELYKATGAINTNLTTKDLKFDSRGFGFALIDGTTTVFEANCYVSMRGNYPVNFSLKRGMHITNDWKLYDLLNQWHFNWRNLPDHLWVNVETLETNPYA